MKKFPLEKTVFASSLIIFVLSVIGLIVMWCLGCDRVLFTIILVLVLIWSVVMAAIGWYIGSRNRTDSKNQEEESK